MPPPSPEEILDALDPEQRAVAEAVTGPVVVLAGAGTGKTRAITHRIAYACRTGQHDPRRTLAVTFTNRAAGELRGRLGALGVPSVSARTFHAAALRQLRYFWPRVVGGSPPELLETKARLVAESASRVRLPTDPALIRDLSSEIEWAKVSQLTPDAYPAASVSAGRSTPGALTAAEVAKVYATYEDVKADRGRMDFEDVLLLTAGMIDDRPDVADEVRTVYRWFTVDEYQDVNPLQQRLLDLWLGERDDLCVVGDAQQTIYTFAGASPRYLLDFTGRHPDAAVVRLVRSYRSTPQVVALANRTLATAKGASAAAGVQLVATRSAGPAVRVTEHDDEPAEAAQVAKRIAALVAAGTQAREIAVLYRMNAQSQVYEEALAEVGVPAIVRGAERFFDRAEVRQAVTLLRGAARGAVAPPAEPEADPEAEPAGGAAGGSAGATAIEAAGSAAGEALAENVGAVLAGMGWTPTAPSGTGAVRERWESLAAVIALAGDVAAAEPTAGIAELVAELDRRAAVSHAPVADGVTLASVHAAKGLEWDAVFVVGLVEGTLPIVHADTPERVEEERRLFYVAVTRARQHLALSWSRARNPGGRGSRTRSRFLDDLAAVGVLSDGVEIPTGLLQAGRATSASDRRRRDGPRRPARCRLCSKALVTGEERTLGRCRSCPASLDEDLLAGLRSWRGALARATGKPAYVVFTDRTLQAIAEQCPQTEDELAAIPGVGPMKLATYGPEVLTMVHETVAGQVGDTSAPG